MKKLIVVAVAIVLIISLIGCNLTDDEDTAPQAVDSEHIYIWTDEETGVQYIVYERFTGYAGAGGITPRLNADGTLYTEEGK